MRKQPRTVVDKMLDNLFQGANGYIETGAARDRVKKLLLSMTTNQRKEALKKMERCDFYVDAKQKGLEERKIRSIMMRKQGISRQNIKEVCDPCKEYYLTVIKSKE